MIKLADFVGETIKQIIDGVRSAQKHAEGSGATVNPSQVYPSQSNSPTDKMTLVMTGPGGGAYFVPAVDFDVAVTTSEGTTTKGGVGVFVAPIAIGSQGQSDAKSTSLSRVRFTIPVSLPEG